MGPIEITLNPAFSAGSLAVSWYGLAIFAAVVIVVGLGISEGRRLGISLRDLLSLAALCVISGVLGAKLIAVLPLWASFVEDPGRVFTGSGFGILGVILGVALTIVVYTRVRGISLYKVADAAAPGALLAQATGRLGCLAAGCCTGTATSLPWGFLYHGPSGLALTSGPVHPTHLYLLLLDLALFGVVWSMRGRGLREGTLGLAYVALYALGDGLISFLRPAEPWWGPLQGGQVLDLAVFLVFACWLVVHLKPFSEKTRVPAIRTG